jgi:enamine deaminase RidA (YjgF/YER057c/UK114 family)
MTIQRIEPGSRMSGAVVHGDTVYLAGQVARNAAGKSVTEQTKDIVSIIDGLLAQAGTDKSKLLSANIWLADISTFDEMNAVWDAWVSPGNTPARATVEAKLAAPQYTVEIMVTGRSEQRPRVDPSSTGARSAFAAFLAIPLSWVSVLMFAAALGFLWLGTVPLTSGLLGYVFGLRGLCKASRTLIKSPATRAAGVRELVSFDQRSGLRALQEA